MKNRRDFIKKSSLFVAASTLPLTAFSIPTQKKKLGVALVGLGYYSRDLLSPALQLTENCELRGIVTGSPDKIPVWKEKYGLKNRNIYNYENMHEIANNDEIDVIYIVLPNTLHKKYALIAANAGKHVWCEKPMATNVADCQIMIDACKKNKVQLTIGYRLQHEPTTQQVIKWAADKPYGNVKHVFAETGFRNGANDPMHWKIRKEYGGGAMFDMGVYALNASRYVTGLEPIAVSAIQSNTRADIFDADETTVFNLEFPGGITASCKASFAENIGTLHTICENGGFELKPFQGYSGVKGIASDGVILSPSSGNQQARQMDDDALAILNGTPNNVLVPGEEGLRDIRVVEAIQKSAAMNGARVVI